MLIDISFATGVLTGILVQKQPTQRETDELLDRLLVDEESRSYIITMLNSKEKQEKIVPQDIELATLKDKIKKILDTAE